MVFLARLAGKVIQGKSTFATKMYAHPSTVFIKLRLCCIYNVFAKIFFYVFVVYILIIDNGRLVHSTPAPILKDAMAQFLLTILSRYLVMEQTYSSKAHGHAILVAGLGNLLVLDATTGLSNILCSETKSKDEQTTSLGRLLKMIILLYSPTLPT